MVSAGPARHSRQHVCVFDEIDSRRIIIDNASLAPDGRSVVRNATLYAHAHTQIPDSPKANPVEQKYENVLRVS